MSNNKVKTHKTEFGVMYNADCFEVMPTLDIGIVDMVMTDPPYGMTGCFWDKKLRFTDLWDNIERLAKQDAAIVICAIQPFTTDLINSNRKLFRFNWVWDKTCGSNIFNLKKYPFRVHEDVLLFAKTAAFTFNPIREFRSDASLKRDPIGQSRIIMNRTQSKLQHYGGTMGTSSRLRNDGTCHPKSIQRFPNKENGRFKYTHPTKKPVKLFSYMIETYTNQNDTVLDMFAGSGTTALACIKTGRRYICVEKEPEYFDLAVRRIEEELQQKTIFGVKE